MRLGDLSQPGPVPYEMDHYRQRRRQLTVQRDPVESGRRAEGLQTGRDMLGGIRVDRAATARVNRLTIQARPTR